MVDQPSIVVTAQLNTLLALPDTDYNADQTAVRKTWLDYLHRSPAHLKAYRDGLMPATEAMIYGQFIHSFILEPHLTGGLFYREPEIGNRNRTDVKAALAELAEQNPGRVAIREAKYDAAVKIRDAVYAHRAARTLLEYDGDFERSIFWDNADTGERCKARYDKVSPRGAFIVDLKTTEDAGEAAFARSIVNYAYHVQANHYTEPTGMRFVFIAVEKSPPHGVAVYAVGDDTIKLGRERRLPDLVTYAECRAKDEWPGYDQSIRRIVLPAWARHAA